MKWINTSVLGKPTVHVLLKAAVSRHIQKFVKSDFYGTLFIPSNLLISRTSWDGISNIYGAQEKNSIPPAYCSLVGRYDNLIPTWFLVPIDFSKIPALNPFPFHQNHGGITEGEQCKVVFAQCVTDTSCIGLLVCPPVSDAISHCFKGRILGRNPDKSLQRVLLQSHR